MSVRIALAALVLASAIPHGARAAAYVIEINKMAYGPAPAQLFVGDTLEWRNNDILRHTATIKAKGFDVDLPPKGHSTVTLTQAGILDVYCKFHPTMKVRLNVQQK